MLSAEGGRETYCDMRSVKRVVGGRGAMVVVCAQLRGFVGESEGGFGLYKKVGRGFGVGSADVGRAFSTLRVRLRQPHHIHFMLKNDARLNKTY